MQCIECQVLTAIVNVSVSHNLSFVLSCHYFEVCPVAHNTLPTHFINPSLHPPQVPGTPGTVLHIASGLW